MSLIVSRRLIDVSVYMRRTGATLSVMCRFYIGVDCRLIDYG